MIDYFIWNIFVMGYPNDDRIAPSCSGEAAMSDGSSYTHSLENS
jgi:hypothetical protein